MKHPLHSLKCYTKTFILFLCCLFTTHLFSQTIDSSFAVNGELTLPIYDDEMYSGSVLYQGDRVLVSSWMQDGERYYPVTNVFRLNTHGNIDTTFGNEGWMKVNSLTGAYFAVQNDKKILITGGLLERDGPDPIGTMAVYRFLPSGKPDLNFGVNGRFSALLSKYNTSLSAVAVKDNGKIVAVGTLPTRDGSADIIALQLNKNGSLDSSFATKGVIHKTSPYEGQSYALKILPDAKILVGFTYTIEKRISGTSIIRYKANGKIDSSFGMNGVVLVGNRITKSTSKLPLSISLANNNKIIVFTADSSAQGVLCRYTKLGKPDSSFGVNGRVTAISHDHYYTFFVTTDSANKILLNQTVSKGIMSVARFKTNGKPDNRFGINGVIPMDTAADAVLVAPDNKLIVYGSFTVLFPPVVIHYKFDSLSVLQNDAVSATMKQNLSENIVVYPNPATNVLHISGLKSNTSYTLNIVDAKGNIMVTKQTTGYYDLNVQQLSSGVYYLNILADGKTYSTKFIKE